MLGNPWIIFFLSFLSGSVMFGFLIPKIKGIDIREHGSGNPGATNVVRVLGKKWGILVFILDFLKAAIPVYFFKYKYVAAAGAILGHVFTPWLGFKGGKGVACTVGAMFVISPVATISGALVFWIVKRITGIVSIASFIMSLSFVLVLYFTNKSNFGRTEAVFSIFIILLILWTHRENWKRLIKGEELKL